MNTNQTFIKAFINAFNGLKYFFLHERNGKIQLLVAILVILTAICTGCTVYEWLAILLCTGLVLGFEMLNTAIEKLCNAVQEEYHPVIKIIKDVAAGAVLLMSFISSIIGAIIFIPKLLHLL
jgi:undecaprenol kinase/diacylglycerol kinase (ATP)